MYSPTCPGERGFGCVCAIELFFSFDLDSVALLVILLMYSYNEYDFPGLLNLLRKLNILIDIFKI